MDRSTLSIAQKSNNEIFNTEEPLDRPLDPDQQQQSIDSYVSIVSEVLGDHESDSSDKENKERDL